MLTDCELIVIPFKPLPSKDNLYRELEQMIYVAISRELMEGHAGISLSSPIKSEARVGRFLEELSKRYAAIGYSSKEITANDSARYRLLLGLDAGNCQPLLICLGSDRYY